MHRHALLLFVLLITALCSSGCSSDSTTISDQPRDFAPTETKDPSLTTGSGSWSQYLGDQWNSSSAAEGPMPTKTGEEGIWYSTAMTTTFNSTPVFDGNGTAYLIDTSGNRHVFTSDTNNGLLSGLTQGFTTPGNSTQPVSASGAVHDIGVSFTSSNGILYKDTNGILTTIESLGGPGLECRHSPNLGDDYLVAGTAIGATTDYVHMIDTTLPAMPTVFSLGSSYDPVNQVFNPLFGDVACKPFSNDLGNGPGGQVGSPEFTVAAITDYNGYKFVHDWFVTLNPTVPITPWIYGGNMGMFTQNLVNNPCITPHTMFDTKMFVTNDGVFLYGTYLPGTCDSLWFFNCEIGDPILPLWTPSQTNNPQGIFVSNIVGLPGVAPQIGIGAFAVQANVGTQGYLAGFDSGMWNTVLDEWVISGTTLWESTIFNNASCSNTPASTSEAIYVTSNDSIHIFTPPVQSPVYSLQIGNYGTEIASITSPSIEAYANDQCAVYFIVNFVNGTSRLFAIDDHSAGSQVWP